MRIQPWMKAVSFAAMLLATESPSSGQTPVYNDGSGYGMPSGGYQGDAGDFAAQQSGFYPAPYQAGGSADPGTLYPVQVPETYQPWPDISPFYPPNVAQTQHVNQDGLWFKQMLYRRRDFSASVGPSIVQFRDAGAATIGSPYVQTGNFGGIGLSLGTPATSIPYAGTPLLENFTPSVNGFYVVNNLVFPYVLTATDNSVLAYDYLYPIWDAGVLGHAPAVAGLQGDLGYMNEDDTGIRISAWGAFQADSAFRRGQDTVGGVALNQTLVQSLGGGILSTLNGNIPLNNGEPGPYSFYGNGSTAKYDLLYSLKFSTTAGGTNMSIYQQPIYKNNGVMLRPLWGARYLHINESLGFRGVDSGFNYDYDVTPSTGTGTGGGGGGTTTTGASIYPDTSSMIAVYSQYEAQLNNKVKSNLAGPELGLRFDLGNSRKGFKVWGESIFGLLVNNQQIDMNGNNIGDPLMDVRFNGYTTPRMLANNANFSNSQNSTHVSPSFQQSVNADFDFIDAIPGLRELSILDNSTFRIGYSVLVVGAVSRPADTIKWQGYPLYPQIERTYDNWWAQQVNFSLNFNF